MWKPLAALVAALAVALTAAPAQAAPRDPVRTLTKELATKRGVSFTEKTDGDFGWMNRDQPGSASTGSRKGRIAYNGSGITAFDMKIIDDPGASKGVIRVGKTIYQETRETDPGWVKSPHQGWSPFFGPINVLEPATLKAVIKHADKQMGAFRVSFLPTAEIWKVSPSYRVWKGKRPTGKEAKMFYLVFFKLGRNGLPQEITTEWPEGRSTITFSSWGKKVTVKAPL
ncbi:hypothetical protein ACIBH1_01860 [Nonomuraea sp. NPDC050663]|uniref:hypothetical protein n=1 Tax=Nonomuraea sp. NPDC050663 TaxID=3364370 RepID=UPI0037BB7555